MSDQHDDVGEYRPGYTDQVDAAIADAKARTAHHVGAGRQAHEVEPGHLPPALAEIERRLLQRVEQLVASRGDGACPHQAARDAKTHANGRVAVGLNRE